MEGLRYLFFLPFAGVICYLLARSFSAPLARLRKISLQIAGGDLTARAGTSLGKPGNEIGDLARDFDHMAERMEGLVNGQKRLLLDISHELRPPLTRSEALAIDADSSPVHLADLLLEIAEDVHFENQNRGKGVTILELEAAVVAGSRELLRQAIENIVRNGAYYTRPESRVEISLSCRESEDGGRLAVIRIRDHGPGVSEDKLPHLTEPFYRVAESRERNSGGTGLAIAGQAVLQHGGTILFANAPDRDGLIVDILLPIGEESAATG